MNDIETALTADDIFAADDAEALRVEVPEWPKAGKPGVLYLRQLPADVVLKYTQEIEVAEEDTPEVKAQKKKRGEDGMFLILALCAVDESGTLIFESESAIAPLRKKNFKVLNRLQRLALAHNSMLPGSEETLKKILGEAASDASPSH